MNTLLNDRSQSGFSGMATTESLSSMSGLVEPGVVGDQAFDHFKTRIDRELLSHAIIHDNPYTEWFRRGEQSIEQVRVFIVQFSVFSNLFLVAQLQKMINADSVDGMRASKEILANEIGVVFNAVSRRCTPENNAADTDPELVATEGSVEGGRFRFRAAHFEWLLRIAEQLELGFNDVGKRRHGTDTTLFFCDELQRLYGSDDYLTSQAASFAVENWAAAGFWKDLIVGLRRFNARQGMNLPLAFFEWHDRLESQHAQHTQDELKDIFLQRSLDQSRFIAAGNAMLNAVAVFWHGLDEQRRTLG